MCIHEYVYVYIYQYTHICNVYMCIDMGLCPFTATASHGGLPKASIYYSYIFICICIHIYKYIYMNMYIYIYDI